MPKEAFVSDFIKQVGKGVKLPKRVRIFDTTLRDGDQTPGVSFTADQKLLVARQLDRLGVDTIEAGTPVSSEGERKAVTAIAKAGLNAEVCGLARAIKEDVDAALECGVDCVHVFISTSDLHLEHMLKMTREQVLRQAVKHVEHAKDHGVTVEFSAMDATRTNLEYLKQIYQATIEAGADRINVPDTVGVITPRGMNYLISQLKPVIKVPISVHCHDDLGLATANSLAAVEAGAEQVQVAVNGLGERAGNASLEEVVMALRALYGAKLKIQTKLLAETSDLVERLTGIPVPPNKAIVGENAFVHVSGIHAHGVLEFPGTYEPISPELVGHHRRLSLGKLTGRHSVEKQLRSIGVGATKVQLTEITKRVKELGDKGKRVTDVDLRAIAESVLGTLPPEEKLVELKEVTVTTGSTITPTASVRVVVRGEERVGSATGVGPVDAAIAAIRNVMKEISALKLKEYHLDAITGGSDALAEVTVKLEDEKTNLYIAKGVREDVVIASVEAMINGINRYFAGRK
ncbi:MAG: 2-isopropylmalate synthase [Hadesarchaea archaeon]|nr:2-isopropylmalate synthase [Hadesarchaea archaeon]MDH5685391.1 2-isopropylmalate synthase [Hadesarchaea archaeon]